ncbi:MAG: Allantoinase [Myxococcaceae bacterium]|nr:Allantoinase [Myxococcaceae bacterium]
MSPPDWVLRGRRVVTAAGVGPAAIHVRGGTILRVADHDDVAHGPVTEAGELVVMPGLVDTHVHINEPGRTEWEGFDTATRAAAAGGVTTLVDMPLNSVPPTTTMAGLEAKAAAAEGKCWVDIAFCGGAVPGNTHELAGMFKSGAIAFKCFLAESGVDEFQHLGEDDLRTSMRTLAEIGAPLLVHAELPGPLAEAAALQKDISPSDARRYATYLASRPKTAEDRAVELVVGLSRELGTRAHIVHLSSADALQILRRAKDQGAPVSAETCPHYLHFTSERIPDGATAFKCAPPIREAENRERLWDALREGLLDQVVTDHSPSTIELKCSGSGDFMRAWGGISSLQLGLPVIWSETRARGGSLADVALWMCARPAILAGLSDRKGTIAEGRDADFMLFDPDAESDVTATKLAHKNKITPYEGERLFGVVVKTWLRGEPVFERGAVRGAARGKQIRRRL